MEISKLPSVVGTAVDTASSVDEPSGELDVVEGASVVPIETVVALRGSDV